MPGYVDPIIASYVRSFNSNYVGYEITRKQQLSLVQQSVVGATLDTGFVNLPTSGDIDSRAQLIRLKCRVSADRGSGLYQQARITLQDPNLVLYIGPNQIRTDGQLSALDESQEHVIPNGVFGTVKYRLEALGTIAAAETVFFDIFLVGQIL